MLGNLLAATGTKFDVVTFMGNQYAVASSFSFLQTIFNIISYALIPLFIAVAAAGSIYAIVLGVNLARAADAETRDAAKKRLIWAIIGLVSIIVLIVLLNWIMTMIPNWVSTYNKGDYAVKNSQVVGEYQSDGKWHWDIPPYPAPAGV